MGGGEWVGGGGATQQSSILEGFAQRSNPSPFYAPFLAEEYPF